MDLQSGLWRCGGSVCLGLTDVVDLHVHMP